MSAYAPSTYADSQLTSSLFSSRISLVQKPSPPLTLFKTDILKLTFQIVEKDSGNGVQPQQTFLRFYDEQSGEEGIQPVRVTKGGKAKFELVSLVSVVVFQSIV